MHVIAGPSTNVEFWLPEVEPSRNFHLNISLLQYIVDRMSSSESFKLWRGATGEQNPMRMRGWSFFDRSVEAFIRCEIGRTIN